MTVKGNCRMRAYLLSIQDKNLTHRTFCGWFISNAMDWTNPGSLKLIPLSKSAKRSNFRKSHISSERLCWMNESYPINLSTLCG
jgi:hypothetical protein